MPGGCRLSSRLFHSRVGTAEIVFLKAHSGRGIFTVGTDTRFPSSFQQQAVSVLLWLFGICWKRSRWEGESINSITDDKHGGKTLLGVANQHLQLGRMKHPRVRPSHPKCSPIHWQSSCQEVLRHKCPPSICSGASARFPVPFQQSPVSLP